MKVCFRNITIFLVTTSLISLVKITSATSCEDAGRNSYCLNCFSTLECVTGGEFLKPCDSGKVCIEDSTSASCVDDSEFSVCECPTTIPAIIPDYYDNSKYICCSADGPHIETCPSGTYFNPATKICDEIYPNTCGTTNDILPINCTFFIVCNPNNNISYVEECPSGSVFNPNSKKCEFFIPFNCSRYPNDGLYPDPVNCSVFHICSGGADISGPVACQEGQVFDPVQLKCVNDAENVLCPAGCETDVNSDVECKDSTAAFKINCKLYYQCTEPSPGVYYPVIEVCPSNLVFSERYETCYFKDQVPEC